MLFVISFLIDMVRLRRYFFFICTAGCSFSRVPQDYRPVRRESWREIMLLFKNHVRSPGAIAIRRQNMGAGYPAASTALI
jgi:hypothetical protein